MLPDLSAAQGLQLLHQLWEIRTERSSSYLDTFIAFQNNFTSDETKNEFGAFIFTHFLILKLHYSSNLLLFYFMQILDSEQFFKMTLNH